MKLDFAAQIAHTLNVDFDRLRFEREDRLRYDDPDERFYVNIEAQGDEAFDLYGERLDGAFKRSAGVSNVPIDGLWYQFNRVVGALETVHGGTDETV